MAFLVELHVTPCMIKHPPGGVCDVLVVATMDDGVANTTRPVGNADVSESSGACKSAARDTRRRHLQLKTELAQCTGWVIQ